MEAAFLPSDFYTLDLVFRARWGLYANFVAQMLSQITSHVIIHYHRRVVTTYKSACSSGLDRKDDNSSALKERLVEHSFRTAHVGGSNELTLRPGASNSVLALAAAQFALVVIGCSLPSFSVAKSGLIGLVVDLGQTDATVDQVNYSLFGIINALFEQADFSGRAGDFIGHGCLSLVLLLSIFLVPLVLPCIHMIQWYHPMSRASRHRLSCLVETLQAWQYTEVYLLSVVIASW